MNELVMALEAGFFATHSGIVRFVTAGVLAVVGVFVAYQGYRGHVRNGNRTLLYLVVGILFLTTIPFVAESWIHATGTLTATQNVLISQLLNILGLVSILYGFTRTRQETTK